MANSFTIDSCIRIKKHSRHYYLGQAAFYLRRGDEKEIQVNMKVVERLQVEIENLEREAHCQAILHRAW